MYLINVCRGNTELERWVAQIKWNSLLEYIHHNKTLHQKLTNYCCLWKASELKARQVRDREHKSF
jgi:hypothetical protein